MTEIAALLSKYKSKGIIIDTNILLLQIVDGFEKVITTPNILTEVNSLANQLGEPERSHS